MKLTVLIASFKRPNDLRRCLLGLDQQTKLPDEVVVVLRDGDKESWQEIEQLRKNLLLRLRVLSVSEPGVIAANNIALPEIESDLVSFIDDDACPSIKWIEKIHSHFSNDIKLGALGGRDRFAHPLMLDETSKLTNRVGKILWYGKIINYHHRVFDGIVEVDSLKGCNMTFRRDLISKCDVSLMGNACYYELDLCFQVKRAGYKVLFDGNLLVDHYLSENHLDRFKRGELHPERVFNDYHNRAHVLFKHIKGPRRIVLGTYWLFLEPNLALLRFLRHRYPKPMQCWKSAVRGSWKGIYGTNVHS